MLNKKTEQKSFLALMLFLVFYCLFLLFFRNLLLNLEKQAGPILKPEGFHIAILSFLILLYYFFFLGIYVFSTLGTMQKVYSSCLAVLIVLGILFGFKQWYTAVSENPFLSIGNSQNLPWYAEEHTKYFIANTPILLFFITVFIYRFLMITEISKKVN
jgi:hypothetical protein